MANTRFSPFELLLKSRNQTDTAALLLLAWIAASQGEISAAAGQRLRQGLPSLACAGFVAIAALVIAVGIGAL